MIYNREHAYCALFQWIKAVVNHVRDRFVIDYTTPLQLISRDNDYWITRNMVDELMHKVWGLGSWARNMVDELMHKVLGLGSWVLDNLGIGSWVLSDSIDLYHVMLLHTFSICLVSVSSSRCAKLGLLLRQMSNPSVRSKKWPQLWLWLSFAIAWMGAWLEHQFAWIAISGARAWGCCFFNPRCSGGWVGVHKSAAF